MKINIKLRKKLPFIFIPKFSSIFSKKIFTFQKCMTAISTNLCSFNIYFSFYDTQFRYYDAF